MTVSLLEGHVVDVLAGLAPGTFHCAVTSPPYLWLRAYGTEPQAWQTADGDALCAPGQHEWGDVGKSGTRLRNGQGSTSPGWHGGKGDPLLLNPPTGSFCVHCHAWRGELGQEPSPELYVEHLVAVFRSVKRVLRDDGTLWVNLAGCYFNDPGGQNGSQGTVSPKAIEANGTLGRQKRGHHPWLKPLDWVDVPGLFARAMQQDGWTWRSDVVWVKPSALPESVSGTRWERCRVLAQGQEKRGAQVSAINVPVDGEASKSIDRLEPAKWVDCPGCPKCSANEGLVLRRGSGRPTKATERVLLFVKQAGYFFDQEAVREYGGPPRPPSAFGRKDPSCAVGTGGNLTGNMRPGVLWANEAGGRNLRDWWVIGPEPLRDAHYAAYPSALPERCIKAGTSEWGCCPSCGAPWARVVSSRFVKPANRLPTRKALHANGQMADVNSAEAMGYNDVTTLGWRHLPLPGVAEQAPVPARVLDPFGGSGTTALAANRLGRDCTLIELKPQYAELARKRVGREPLSLFAWQGAEHEDAPEEVPV